MPLASSRSASEQRAAKVKEEKAREARRNPQRKMKTSYPRTCNSTTRVNHEKIERRRLSRNFSLEPSKRPIEQDNSNTGDSTKENQVMMSPGKQGKNTENQNGEAVKSPETNKVSFPNEIGPMQSPTPYWKVRRIMLKRQML